MQAELVWKQLWRKRDGYPIGHEAATAVWQLSAGRGFLTRFSADKRSAAVKCGRFTQNTHTCLTDAGYRCRPLVPFSDTIDGTAVRPKRLSFEHRTPVGPRMYAMCLSNLWSQSASRISAQNQPCPSQVAEQTGVAIERRRLR